MPPVSRALNRVRSFTVSPLAIVGSIVAVVLRHPANRGRRARVLARAALALAWFRCTGIPVLAPLGRRSQLLTRPRLFNSVTAAPWYGNPPDPHATALLAAVLRPGDLFVDVGANVGVYTVLAAEAGADVLAVEPSSDAADLLERNVRLNGYQPQVRIHRVAAGARSRPGRLTRGTDVLNRVVEDDQSPAGDADAFWTYRPAGVESITIARLDDLVGDKAFVAAMKIDVEGQEFEALQGAERLLRAHRVGYLQIENNATSEVHYGRSNERVWAYLRELGYELRGFADDGRLVPESGRPRSAEIVAVAPSGFFDTRREHSPR